MSESLFVKNDGPLILDTNYWDLPEAKLGTYLVSCNAGAFRLLLPALHEPALDDMRTAKGVAVSRGPWPDRGLDDAFEILFDDGSKDPFALHCAAAAFDRIPTDSDTAGEWVFSAWTRPRRGVPHKALERPCRYRRSTRLPDLRPWEQR